MKYEASEGKVFDWKNLEEHKHYNEETHSHFPLTKKYLRAETLINQRFPAFPQKKFKKNKKKC